MPLYSATCPLPKNQMLRRHQSSAPFSPIDIAGISLWLKADTGVSTEQETFISEIVISSAGTTTSNGTYTRASGGNTQFNGPNGNYIYNAGGGSEWAIFDTQLYDPEVDNYGNDSYYTEGNSLFEVWYISGANLGANLEPSGVVTTTTVNTDNVTAWADQSGNGNNCSSPNNVEFLSSPYPNLYFGGINAESEITLHPDVFNSFSALSLFAVWSIIEGENGGILGSTTYSNFEIVTQDGSVVRMRNNNYDENINTGGFWYADEFCLSTIAVDSSNDSGTARRNGSTTGVDFDGANSQGLQGGQTYKIGVYGGSYFAELSLAELIVYSDKLDGSQINQVEGYLNAKYGIY